jgi:hypothetical protein
MIELRYSPTCSTVWARVTNVNRAGVQATGISRTNTSKEYDYVDGTCANGNAGRGFCKDTVAANVSSYGYQIYRNQSLPVNVLIATGYICYNSSCTSYVSGESVYGPGRP